MHFIKHKTKKKTNFLKNKIIKGTANKNRRVSEKKNSGF